MALLSLAIFTEVLAASQPAPNVAATPLLKSDTSHAPTAPMLLASINAILCLVISCPLDISVASCLALSLSSAFEPSHVPYIIDSDGIVSATSNIQNVITSGFLSVSHIRKLYNIIHNAIEINLNIQRYWLPGSIFNTGYSAVVVHNSIIIPVKKPVLDFLYPKNIP